ncbi:MAG: lysophospholipid acyltransferase family protein [Myxococcota bacterium]
MRPSTVDHPGPRTPWLLYWVARLWMRLFGWDVEGDAPQVTKAILIAAPHTSNWDLPHMLAASLVFRLRISWLGKHTLFRPPWGWFMRLLGGVAIDRRAPQGSVKATAEVFDHHEKLVNAVPPSGTRSKRDHWKSGFYWIAHTAQVPIVCGYLDYGRRRAGLGFSFLPSGDIAADMDKIRAFYADKRGRFPEQESDIRLLEEVKAAAVEAGEAPPAPVAEQPEP